MNIDNRPRPIKAAADELKSWVGFATLVTGGAAGAGINLLTDEQATALTALLSAVPGVVGLVSATAVAFGVVKRSEPLVTPLEDPRTAQGERLYPMGQ